MAAAAQLDDILPRVACAPGFTAGYWLEPDDGAGILDPEWVASHTPSAELWLRPDDGHVSVLTSAEAAMAWLREQAGRHGEDPAPASG